MEFIRAFTRELEVGDRAELFVDGRAGTVAVRGEATSNVRIEVVARLWADDELEAEEQADLIARGIKQDGRRVTIRAPAFLRPHPLLFFGRSPRIDYQVTVPRTSKADVASRSGRVEVESLAGPLEVSARSGRVSVREIGDDTTVVSRSGSVQAESIGGSLVVESRSGSVRAADCAGDVTVRSRSGSVQAEEIAGRLNVESHSGSVRYEGDVRASMDVRVESGSVRLAVNPQRAFFLDAESAHGAVRSDLSLRKGAGPSAPGPGAPVVRVRARSGSIHIAPR